MRLRIWSPPGRGRGIRTPPLGYEPSELPLLYHRNINGVVSGYPNRIERKGRKNITLILVAKSGSDPLQSEV